MFRNMIYNMSDISQSEYKLERSTNIEYMKAIIP